MPVRGQLQPLFRVRKPSLKQFEIALVVAFLALFAIIAFIARGEATAFDREVLLAMRNASGPVGPVWLQGVVRDITALGGHAVLIIVVLVVASYLLLLRDKVTALFVVLSALSGIVINSVLKLVFDRARPDIITHLTEVASLSFPSGHAALSAVVYLTLGALLAGTHRSFAFKAYFIGVAVTLVILVGLSRVYLGVHYPTDVLAGWCFGAAWALICLAGLRYLQRERVAEPPETP